MEDGNETLDQAVWLFLADCKLRNLSPLTLEWYTRKLGRLCLFCPDLPLKELTSDYLRDFLNSLTVKSSTRNANLRGIKAFLNFCVREDLIKESVAQRVQRAKEHQPIIATLSDEQITKLLKAIPQVHFVGLRDFALILLLLDTGARISEAVHLNTTDLSLEAQSIHIRNGKGNKARELPIGKATIKALMRYLVRRKSCKEEHLFVSATGEPLDRSQCGRNLARYGRKAKITGVRLSPHTLRYTFAKKWILAGGDAFSLQRMLGHTTLEITKRYVNLFTTDLQAQHKRFSPVDNLEAILSVRRKRLR